MPGINGKSVRDFRVERAWSQEHLAELCGLSVRTVARAERRSRASLDTVRALAATFGVSPSSLMNAGPPGPLVKRITPMTVLACIGPALRNYRVMGFSVIETDDPGCVGLSAGRSAPILATTHFMAGDFREASIAPLEGRTIPYIWVASLDAAKRLLPVSAILVEEAATRAGTLEALVKQSGRYTIFAEKRLRPAKPCFDSQFQ